MNASEFINKLKIGLKENSGSILSGFSDISYRLYLEKQLENTNFLNKLEQVLFLLIFFFCHTRSADKKAGVVSIGNSKTIFDQVIKRIQFLSYDNFQFSDDISTLDYNIAFIFLNISSDIELQVFLLNNFNTLSDNTKIIVSFHSSSDLSKIKGFKIFDIIEELIDSKIYYGVIDKPKMVASKCEVQTVANSSNIQHIHIKVENTRSTNNVTVSGGNHNLWCLDMFKKKSVPGINFEGISLISNAIVVSPGIILSPDGKQIFTDIGDPEKIKTLSHSLFFQPIKMDYSINGSCTLLNFNEYPHSDWIARGFHRACLPSELGIISKLVHFGKLSEFRRSMLVYAGFEDDNIIQLEEDKVYKIEKLIAPHNRSIYETNSYMSEFYKKITERVSVEPKYRLPDIFFIKRKKRNSENMRWILNEDDLCLMIEQRNIPSIYLEDLSFEEEVRLFNNAKLIIGELGAGLYNTVFCQPGTKIIAISSINYIFLTPIHFMSDRFGLKVHYCVGESFFDKDARYIGTAGSWICPVEAVEAAINDSL